ncbi:glycosyltransferase family 39 protein [Leptolyngbya ohadii]|uniref:glycosyltransferase family 39 protein n=1 Tax=Leptolyngbya ohadii TaxID=1962290 RepID=UPI0015C5AB47|nr:glycosyltransferase family 39 protein [Leptolyngbya ohadii]
MKRRSLPNSLQAWLRWLLIGALVLGIGFRFLNLDRKILWHDEVYTSMRASGYTRYEIDNSIFRDRFIPARNLQWYQQPKLNSTFADTIYSLAIEDPQHPPFYFVAARFWMMRFGNAIGTTRLLPVLLSLPALFFMYKLAIELFGSRLTAGIAAALLAMSPFDILFAQTNRQYSLLTTMVIGSSWLLLRAMRLPSWWNWGLYMMSLAIGLYTHPFFAFTIVAHGIYVLVIGKPVEETPVQETRLLPSAVSPAPPKTQENPAVTEDFNPANAIVHRAPEVNLPQEKLTLRRIIWRNLQTYTQFGMAVLEALLLFSPWIAVMYFNRDRALATTNWTQAPTDYLYLLKLWLLSFTSLFVDLDFGFNNPITYLVRIPFLLLAVAGMVLLWRTTKRKTWLFVLLNFAVPFLLLVGADLALGGKRSAVSRYLISSYPAIQLAVAYWFGVTLGQSLLWQNTIEQIRQIPRRWQKFLTRRSVWFGVLIGVLTASFISCSVSAMAETWWSKDLSYLNARVAQIINREAETSNPVIVSDIGDDYTNTGDLISLSFRLADNVRYYTVSDTPNLEPIAPEPNVILFRPSQKIRAAIEQQGWALQPFFQDGKLWQLKR